MSYNFKKCEKNEKKTKIFFQKFKFDENSQKFNPQIIFKSHAWGLFTVEDGAGTFFPNKVEISFDTFLIILEKLKTVESDF